MPTKWGNWERIVIQVFLCLFLVQVIMLSDLFSPSSVWSIRDCFSLSIVGFLLVATDMSATSCGLHIVEILGQEHWDFVDCIKNNQRKKRDKNMEEKQCKCVEFVQECHQVSYFIQSEVTHCCYKCVRFLVVVSSS